MVRSHLVHVAPAFGAAGGLYGEVDVAEGLGDFVGEEGGDWVGWVRGVDTACLFFEGARVS